MGRGPANGRSVTLLPSRRVLDRLPAPTDALLMPERTLAALSVGEAATVREVGGDGTLAVRLLEMGFVPGTSVKLVKLAPLGDPMQFEVRGYHLSLRRAEAARIRVL